MSLAPAKRRGLDLNCRFEVNGIQKASRLFGVVSKTEDWTMAGSWGRKGCDATMINKISNSRGNPCLSVISVHSGPADVKYLERDKQLPCARTSMSGRASGRCA